MSWEKDFASQVNETLKLMEENIRLTYDAAKLQEYEIWEAQSIVPSPNLCQTICVPDKGK